MRIDGIDALCAAAVDVGSTLKLGMAFAASCGPLAKDCPSG